MGTGDEQQDKGRPKGFAGISSLASDVEVTEPAPGPDPSREAKADDARTSSQQQQRSPAHNPKRHPPGGAPSPSTGPYWWKWVLGILVVIGAISLWSHLSSNGNARNSVARVPPSQSVDWQSSRHPSPSSPQRHTTKQQPSETRLVVSKPPVGTGHVLSVAQISYCLAEDTRLDAAKPVVNQYVGTEVDRYNAMVGDYNSRCSKFKYRRGDLQAAREDVQQYQSKLQAEGRSRFATAASTQRGKNHARRQLVRSIQQALNAQGYGVGQADGIAGEKTRSAIRSFQRDMSLPVDGKPSRKLLRYLQATQRLKRNRKRGSTAQARSNRGSSVHQSTLPAHAVVSPYGLGWSCRRGYRKRSSRCVAVRVPAHGQLNYLGSGWECQRGYRKSGSRCVAVRVPAHGQLNYLGSGWECQRGYRKSGDRCVVVQVPKHGQLNYLGSGWECEPGYRRYGQGCIATQ